MFSGNGESPFPENKYERGERMKTLRDKKAIVFFLAPAFLIYTWIVFIPIIESVYYSMIDWNGIGSKVFVGLDNYILLFKDSVFVQALSNNLRYIMFVVFIQIIFGLTAAVLLTYLKKGRGFIQTVYFIPSVITVVAIIQLFRTFYSFEPVGLLNQLLIFLGFNPVAFLSDYSTALFSVALVEGWQYIGIYMIIFYSALVSIPGEIEEAGRIDGANELQLLFKIKFPYIKNVFGLALILSLVGGLRGFAAPLLLTRGGPNHQSEILATYMYKKAFSSQQLGYGSSISVVIMILSLVCVLLINRYSSRSNE